MIKLSELKKIHKSGKSIYYVNGFYGKELKLKRSNPTLTIEELKFVENPFEHYVYGFGTVDSYLVHFVNLNNQKHERILQLFKEEDDWVRIRSHRNYMMGIRDPDLDFDSFFLTLAEAQTEYDRRKKLSMAYYDGILLKKRRAISTIEAEILSIEETKKQLSM